MSELVVNNSSWKEEIRFYYENTPRVLFLRKIWWVSQTAFDMPREIQVIIDSNDHLFMSVGTPGFVSFEGQDDELYEKDYNMTLPIKEWIHTHPFGDAYFSGTDLQTISMWERVLDKATVLGDGERMTMSFRVGENNETYQEYTQFVFGDEEE